MFLRNKFLLGIFLVIGFLFFIGDTDSVIAANTPRDYNGGGSNSFVSDSYYLEDVIRYGVALTIFFSGMLTILFVLWGGVQLILSGGKDEKVKPALNSIRFAIIGIIIIFVILFVAPKAGDLLGLNVSNYFDPGKIFTTVQEVSRRIFSGDTNSSSFGSFSSSGQPATLEMDFDDL